MELGEWCGIELDQAIGTNDGSVTGIRYFRSQPNHGMFSPESDVHPESSSGERPVHHLIETFVVARSIYFLELISPFFFFQQCRRLSALCTRMAAGCLYCQHPLELSDDSDLRVGAELQHMRLHLHDDQAKAPLPLLWGSLL